MDAGFMLQTVFRQLVTNGFPVALIFAMSRFKCGRKTVWLCFAAITAIGTAVNSLLIFRFGDERMKQVFALILFLPSLLFLLFQTKDKPSQLLFNFFTAINGIYFSSIISHFIMGGALDRPQELIWLDATVRGGVFAVILFLFARYLREPYQFLAANMKQSGWRVLCVIPMLFFGLVMFLGLYPHVRTDNLLGVTFLYVILGFVYFIIYQVFHTTYSLLKIQNDNDALRFQVQAMERQAEMILQNDEQVRIYRHDLRHYIADAIALLQSGESDEALRVLCGFDDRSQKTRLRRCCDNPAVNAILGYYIQEAEEAGITVRAECHVPTVLPVEAAELAMVLANAIENAIHACLGLPASRERWISIRVVNLPQLAVEVSNSYNGQVTLDAQGFPVSGEAGHGLGTKSIRAFVEKYDGVLDYKADETTFRLRLLVNSPQEAACGAEP